MFTSQLKTVNITALFATMFFALLTINLFNLYKFDLSAKYNLAKDERINSIPVEIFVSNINEIKPSEETTLPINTSSHNSSFSALNAFINQTKIPDQLDANENLNEALPNNLINGTANIQTHGCNKLDLNTRKALKLAQVSHSDESGVVEVIIKVDSNGKVISAEANGRKTNTSSNQLKTLACNAALNSFFEPINNDEIQTGSIIYNFDF